MKNIQLPVKYLDRFKQFIKYYYNDQDDLLSIHLETATKNILTQYMEIPESDFNKQEIVDLITNNNNFLLAVMTLASTTYQNADIMLTNTIGSVVDTNNIYRILGGLTTYYKFSNGVNDEKTNK